MVLTATVPLFNGGIKIREKSKFHHSSIRKFEYGRTQNTDLASWKTRNQAIRVLANPNASPKSERTKKEVIMVDPLEAKRLAVKQMEEIKAKERFKRRRQIEAINGAWALNKCTLFGNQCLYDYKYAEGTIARGWIADDVITFVLDQHPVRILFGCGRDQASGMAFSGEYSGIVGIGRRVLKGGYSLPSQFEADIIAMCLPGAYSTQGSTISFHTTPFKKITSADLLPNYGFPTFYYVNLYKNFINDKEVPLYPSFSRNFGNYDMTGGCIVDTGTVITRFPRDFYTVFRDTETGSKRYSYDGGSTWSFRHLLYRRSRCGTDFPRCEDVLRPG